MTQSPAHSIHKLTPKQFRIKKSFFTETTTDSSSTRKPNELLQSPSTSVAPLDLLIETNLREIKSDTSLENTTISE